MLVQRGEKREREREREIKPGSETERRLGKCERDEICLVDLIATWFGSTNRVRNPTQDKHGGNWAEKMIGFYHVFKE